MGLFHNLSEKEQRLRTMTALAAVYRKSMRILSGRPLETTVVDHPGNGAPSWTVQQRGRVDNIHFNLPHIGPLKTASDIVRVTGMAHHERCHVQRTPKFAHTPAHPIGALFHRYGAAAFNAFNILEDQRIESQDIVQYPSVVPFYRAMVAEVILAVSEEEMTYQWLLVHGRRYLGDKIRDAMKAVFKYPEHIAELTRIIDEYRALNLYKTSDLYTAATLIDRFREIMYGDMDAQPQPNHADHQPGTPSETREGRAEAQQAAQGVAEGKDESNEDSSKGKGKGSGGKDEDTEKDDSKSKGGDGSDEEDDSEDEDDGDGDGDSDDDDSTDASNKGAGTHGGSNSSNIKDMAQAMYQAAMEDDGVRADVQRTKHAVANAGHEDTIGNHRGWVNEVRPDVVPPARLAARKLERIKHQYDPGWDSHQDSGKLNVQRVMRNEGRLSDDAFDQWNEGNADATDIETVMLVDVSGSMSGHTRALSDATWAIKHAHDRIGASCWVYSFDSSERLVYRGDERAKTTVFPAVRADGGTTPGRALIEAARILSKSKRAKKLMVVLTDGDWSEYGLPTGMTNDGIIKEMNGAGVVTAMAYLSSYRSEAASWHNTQVHASMTSLAALPPFVDDIVRRVIRTNTK